MNRFRLMERALERSAASAMRGVGAGSHLLLTLLKTAGYYALLAFLPIVGGALFLGGCGMFAFTFEDGFTDVRDAVRGAVVAAGMIVGVSFTNGFLQALGDTYEATHKAELEEQPQS